MNVVAALPPAQRQAAAEISDENSNQCVGEHGTGDASMSCVMGSEHYLMLGSVRGSSDWGWVCGLAQNNPREAAEVKYQPALKAR